MSAPLNDSPFVEHDDFCRVANGGEPMCNHQRRARRHRGVQCPLHRRFVLGVQVGSCFIQHNNSWGFQQQPGQGDTLLLTTGQAISTFAHHGVKAHRQGHHHISDLGRRQRGVHLVVRRVWLCETQVCAQGVMEEV